MANSEIDQIESAIRSLSDQPGGYVEYGSIRIPVYSVYLEDIPEVLNIASDLIQVMGFNNLDAAMKDGGKEIKSRLENIDEIMKLISTAFTPLYILLSKLTRLSQDSVKRLPANVVMEILMEAKEVNSDFLAQIRLLLGISGSRKESQSTLKST